MRRPLAGVETNPALALGRGAPPARWRSRFRARGSAVKLLGMLLASLLVLVQYPLWLGQGSWLRVWELDRQLSLQQEVNAGKRMRNEGLEAEVADLRDGTIALEERARYELGMVKRDEIFVQFGASGGAAGGGGQGGATGATGALSHAIPPTAARPAPAHPAAGPGATVLRVGR